MSNYDLILETVKALRFNVGTDDMTDEMIADEVNKTLIEEDGYK